MKKFLPFFSALVMMFPGISLFAQGGDDCATAQANPITLPFTGSGSTCNGTDNYPATMTTTCIPNYYFGMNDWVYYFCANSSGMLQITLDFGSNYPYSSISLWSGCPPNGNCVSATTSIVYNSQTLTYQSTLSVQVQQNQCFFIVIDGWNIVPCFPYTINASIVPPPPINPTCVNVDFETGNFNGWYGTDGTITCGATNAPYPQYNYSTSGLPSPQHTIMSGPGLDACGGFPIVCPGGNYSAMIGDGQNVGSLGGTLEQSFMVSANNSAFTYKYAAVVQDAQHLSNEQPWFQVDMYDQNGNIIQCAHYVVVGGPNIPGFFPANCSFGVYYRPWTTVNVDLSAYIGQSVRLLFTVGDCCYGGHFGYVYVDCSCTPMQISGNDSICLGNSTTLSAPSGSSNYSWSTGASTQSITVSPTQQPYQIYTCTLTSVTNPNCLTVLKDTVWVFPSPNAQFTAIPNGNCGGGSVNVNNNTQNQQGYQYSWTWGDNTSSTQMNPPNHTYSSSGTYTITLYVTSGGCVDTATQVINLNGSGVTAQFSNTTVCLNNATQFTDQTTGGPASWSWNFGDPNSGPNNTSNLQNPSHTFTAAGNYTVTLIAAPTNAQCGDTIQLMVTVDPLPSPAFIANAVCVGTPTQFTDQSTIQTGNITAWAWNFGDPNSGPNNLSTQQNPTHTFSAAGTYTVTLTTTSASGCMNSTTVVVTVYPLPTAAFVATTVCQGSPTTFTDQSTNAVQWAWDFGDNTTSSIQSPTHTYTTAGTYTASLVVTGQGGCTATVQVTVTVNPGPASAFVATTVCVGNPTTFTDQSTIQSGNITNWSWNFGDNTTSLQQNPAHVYASAGTYTVTLTTTSNNGCTNTVTMQVVVNPLPVAAFTNTSVCVNAATQFTDQSTNAAQWAWNFGDNATSLLQNPSHTYAAAGTYTVTLIVQSAAGCIDTVQQPISVYPLPVVNFTADDTDGCVTHCVNFTDLSTVTTGSITGWSWDFGDGGSSTAQNPNHCYTVAGTYDVTLTVTSSNGCSMTYTNFAYIVVYPLPVAEFSASPNPASIIDPTIHFTDLSQGNPITWAWTFGDSGSDTIQNPSHTYPNDNTGIHYYTVTLFITDQHGCTSTVDHVVEVDPEFTFYVPNCFTPNNDGTNDLFFTYGVGVVQFKMWIFDRWGNKIWWTDDMNKGWNGKVLGGASDEVVQEDVYVWKVQLTDVFDKKHSYVGHVSVIK